MVFIPAIYGVRQFGFTFRNYSNTSVRTSHFNRTAQPALSKTVFKNLHCIGVRNVKKTANVFNINLVGIQV